jgi:hypothetical protein
MSSGNDYIVDDCINTDNFVEVLVNNEPDLPAPGDAYSDSLMHFEVTTADGKKTPYSPYLME